jgi:hypothetical protein
MPETDVESRSARRLGMSVNRLNEAYRLFGSFIRHFIQTVSRRGPTLGFTSVGGSGTSWIWLMS